MRIGIGNSAAGNRVMDRLREKYDAQLEAPLTIHVENDNPTWTLLMRYGQTIRDRTGCDEARLRSITRNGRLEMALALGAHILRWQDHTFRVVVWESDSREGARVTLQCPDALRAFENFLVCARNLAKQKSTEDAKSIVLKVFKGGTWKVTSTNPKRHPDSLVLMNDACQAMLADMRHFRASEHEYAAFGFPFKRNYLAVGPPGSGKSSLAAVAASELDLDLCYLHITHGMTERDFCAAVSTLTDRSMLVIEDAELICINANAGNASAANALSLLTNVLDGTLHRHGLITFITSADPESLDPTLIRHGRIDHTTQLTPLTQQHTALITRKLLHLQHDQADHIADTIWRNCAHAHLSSTALAHFLFRHRHTPPKQFTDKLCSQITLATIKPPAKNAHHLYA